MDEQPLIEILKRMHGQRIVIVGDVMLDEYVWGEVRRISPEAPVPVVEMQRRTYVPGGAANSAANIVSLGGKALLAGVVGVDAQAEQLRTALCENGVDVNGILTCATRQTTTKTRIIAHQQQIVRVDLENRAALDIVEEDQLLSWFETQVRQCAACVLSDYAKGVVSARLAKCVIDLARAAGKPVVVDPKGNDYVKYRGATIVKPNVHEAERVTKQDISTEANVIEAGQALSAALDGTAVLITRGPNGMSLFRRGQPPFHIPTVARKVFDVTGAGDTVVAALASALGAGANLEQAVSLANTAAGIVVGKVGTATVGLDELTRFTIGSSDQPVPARCSAAA